ncbi:MULTISPECIES: PLDc N-terminal domain-containing protein [unclassified Leifsonia]|uniref:PLDc N-terminal domain-containing protein n=1 Tax=unclassified Leifsonia TaxID=2663824 RepID=UPI0006F9D22D|nr:MULTISPECIES: PLDc N-terminal domain-containing protein [unclassified Leifsonia]KQX07773.1 hypothetical protein ASC59_08590 [Leifsonia sp. Root1293]KRA12055.1 hypothetical protein ASD61_08590 [Leifsonia sp. Root60]
MFIWDFVSWFFWFYIAICCLVLFLYIAIDVFRDEELNGWAKAFWLVFLVLVPLLGCLVYLIARHRSITMRRNRDREVVHDSPVGDFTT